MCHIVSSYIKKPLLLEGEPPLWRTTRSLLITRPPMLLPDRITGWVRSALELSDDFYLPLTFSAISWSSLAPAVEISFAYMDNQREFKSYMIHGFVKILNLDMLQYASITDGMRNDKQSLTQSQLLHYGEFSQRCSSDAAGRIPF